MWAGCWDFHVFFIAFNLKERWIWKWVKWWKKKRWATWANQNARRINCNAIRSFN